MYQNQAGTARGGLLFSNEQHTQKKMTHPCNNRQSDVTKFNRDHSFVFQIFSMQNIRQTDSFAKIAVLRRPVNSKHLHN